MSGRIICVNLVTYHIASLITRTLQKISPAGWDLGIAGLAKPAYWAQLFLPL
jgi:hypothetical protein